MAHRLTQTQLEELQQDVSHDLLGENKVLNVFFPALKEQLINADDSDSDSSVEVVGGGNGKRKKQPRASSSSSSSDLKIVKRARVPTPPTTIPILSLSLTYDVNSSDAGSSSSSFIKALRKVPSQQHPHPLTSVELSNIPVKAPAKPKASRYRVAEPAPLAPKRPIQITTPDSRKETRLAPLFEVHSFEPDVELTFTDGKGGDPWYNGDERPSFGEGSLLDALVALENKGLVELEGQLSVELPDEDITTDLDNELLLFHLRINVSLRPAFLTPHLSLLPAKRLFLEHLFPQSESSNGGGLATVDFFYKSLRRAPITFNGLPVAPSPSTVPTRINTPIEIEPEETEEERTTRERREAKGKGKAVELDAMDVDDDGADGFDLSKTATPKREEEDELLRPKGLKPTLMPFQSRTVRWLLAREGKVVKPRKIRHQAAAAASTSSNANNSSGKNGDVHLDHAEEEEEDDLYGPPIAEAEFEYEGTNSVCELVDVDEEWKEDLARGPLWEEVELETPEGMKKFWLNRVGSGLMVEDPIVWNMGRLEEGVEQEKEEKVKGEDEDVLIIDADDEDEEPEETEKDPTADFFCGSALCAEEVGLGKTVEIISLILLHRDTKRFRLPTYFSRALDTSIQPSGITLIIAPSAIVGQWAQELTKHAPGLRVLRYEAIKKIKDTWTPLYIAQNYDVVLTTFDTLRHEVVFARKPHKRSLRSGNEYKARYRRSLLVTLSYLRVVIDETQNVGDSASVISETASLIPRQHSIAVTSTPLKSRIEDLQGLLAFLRLYPFAMHRQALGRLLEEKESFVRLWNQLGARTLKEQVEHELIIPPQERLVVPVEFSAVEKVWYETRYAEALEALGLNRDGEPYDEQGWEPQQGELNKWLAILRQLCVHPQVGQGNKLQLGTILKSVEDVLSSMREKAVSGVQNDQRALFAARVKRGQLLAYDKESCERFEDSLEILQGVMVDMKPLIDEIAQGIREQWNIRKDRLRLQRSGSVDSDTSDESNGLANLLGLGLEEEQAETDGKGKEMNEKDRNILKSLGALRSRLRELLFLEHSALFFSGNSYFNMGKYPDEEANMYERAEQLRSTLLRPYELQVEKATKELTIELARRQNEQELDLDDMEFKFGDIGHGLVAIQTFEDIETTCDVLNGYAEIIWTWRDMILQMMKTKVSIVGDGATGDEYEQHAELQQRLDCYLEMYGVVLNEWRVGITGEKTALANELTLDQHRSKKSDWAAADPTRKRTDKKKKQKLADMRVPSLEFGDTPEEILRFELMAEIIRAKGEENEMAEIVPLRTSVVALRTATTLNKYQDREGTYLTAQEQAAAKQRLEVELTMLNSESARLRKLLPPKEKVAERLRAEVLDITTAFNVRLRYFAVLQQLSDAVADPKTVQDKKWKGFPTELELLEEEEEKLELSIKQKSTRRRYLDTLHEDTGTTEEDVVCPICSDVFAEGILTQCGHLTCKDCFKAWHDRSRSCALCKTELRPGDWQRVKYRKKVIVEDAEDLADDAQGGEGGALELVDDALKIDAPIELNTISRELLEQIEEVQTYNPLSSKSDQIVKHVKMLRREDPTAKVIVFSAWVDSLKVLMAAFDRNGLSYVQLEASGNKSRVVDQFNNDPNVAAFFLNMKSQSAGLNLTIARYVLLVEPLLHPSLETQAVARVHRIGQTQFTTVFQYYVADSVDQRVAELRARQNTSLFLASNKPNAAAEARLNQQDMSSKSAANKLADGTIEDEDEVTRCLLDPKHFLALQRSMLPLRLRAGPSAAASKKKVTAHQPVAGPAPATSGEAAIAPVAAGSGRARVMQTVKRGKGGAEEGK